MFIHAGWLHILANMLFLWVFGDNVENAMGHFRYLIFYLLCGIAAGLAQSLVNVNSTVPTLEQAEESRVPAAYLCPLPYRNHSDIAPFSSFRCRSVCMPGF